MKSRFDLVSILALAIAGCGHSGGVTRAPGDEPQANVLVRFTDMSIEPAVAKIPAGGNVAWTNMASNYNGVVSFPLGVEGSFTCS